MTIDSYLMTTSAKQDNSVWNDTTPTSSVWSMNDNGDANGSGSDYIAYCFAEKTGYSIIWKISGNGNADGTFVYTGFKPAFVIVKDTSTTANWGMIDNKREGYNSNNQQYEPNDGDAQDNTQPFDILSNGFKLRTSGSAYNRKWKYIHLHGLRSTHRFNKWRHSHSEVVSVIRY